MKQAPVRVGSRLHRKRDARERQVRYVERVAAAQFGHGRPGPACQNACPHDALVRMAQPFSLRYPLIKSQGNFGSLDGDPPAAMRYTEVRMARFAGELLRDIEKETVDFAPNYDESLHEPLVMPSAIPNLLVNGSSGIAVGMATNMPPHNLGEVIDGTIALIDNTDMDVKQLMKHIKGPDASCRAASNLTLIINGYHHHGQAKTLRLLVITFRFTAIRRFCFRGIVGVGIGFRCLVIVASGRSCLKG